MKIIKELSQFKPPSAGTVLTIGNFDGVHLGHREMFRQVVNKAQELQASSAVLTFEPHPLRFLAPQRAPLRINTPQEKVRLIDASCIDLLLIIAFTREFAELPPKRFVEEILLEGLAMRCLIVGYDYAFGKNRQGNIDFLREIAARRGFQLEVLPPISRGELVYSSSRIRQTILAGQVAEVVEVLGRNFTLDGVVVHGDGRGRNLGFPTANLQTEKELLPCPGVYAVKVKWCARYFDAVVNLGRRPTFAGIESRLEIHLLDFVGDLYGETLRLYFVERLRDEQRFASAEDLKTAVRVDVDKTRSILQGRQIVEYRDYLDCGDLAGGPCVDHEVN
ncbi:MAG: riboflavin biosynthesis protein RibF [Desulfuromonas sp.]|nr:MAG: riboflavin biosynthesis protein RibF [Desulfuromonas sp.]